jgi:hypothetical protein
VTPLDRFGNVIPSARRSDHTKLPIQPIREFRASNSKSRKAEGLAQLGPV